MSIFLQLKENQMWHWGLHWRLTTKSTIRFRKIQVVCESC